tara:strand:- start:4564 stop:6048 length:1485 start_codon:yes stop_codon:yes gene_type:complete
MKKSIVLLFQILLINLVCGQQNENRLNGIDKEIETLMKSYKAVGLSVAVVKNDRIIYSKGFGFRNLEKNLPVTDRTIFHIASMTKAFTGSLFGILESENQLSLKDKPVLYIPNLQFYNEKMNNLVTIEDLLSHKSGLGNHDSSIVLFPELDKLKTVKRLEYLKPQAEIKNSWAYSNLGYTLAGTVVEQITGKSWDVNIQERIFDPLQMNTSCTTIESMIKSKNYALGYAMYDGKIENVPFENYYSYTPAGAIKSSAVDLSSWMRVWLNKGDFKGSQVIPQNYIEKATTLQNIRSDVYEKDSFLYGEGFGWRLRSWFGHYRIRHGGNTNGFSTVLDMFPHENIGIVVLSNQKSSLLPYAISDCISRKLLNLNRFDFPVIVDDIYKPDMEDKPFNIAKMPSQPITNFTGSYDAKGYGKIHIKEQNNRLYAIFPTYKFKLEHLNYNSFYLKGIEDFNEGFNPEFTIKFVVDTKGTLTTLELYALNDPVEFLKLIIEK